jgi:hypothetical protein
VGALVVAVTDELSGEGGLWRKIYFPEPLEKKKMMLIWCRILLSPSGKKKRVRGSPEMTNLLVRRRAALFRDDGEKSYCQQPTGSTVMRCSWGASRCQRASILRPGESCDAGIDVVVVDRGRLQW